MVDIEFIRKKHFVEGWTIRKISRQFDVSRQAVRKSLASADLPRYRLTKARPCAVMDPFRDIVQGWLEQDDQAPPKQRHTSKRIFDRLVAEYTFAGAESTVRHFVAKLRPARREVYIPLEARAGQQAQIDWGQAVVRIGGEPAIAHLFCLRMRASGVAFAWAAPTEKLEAFLEGHCRAFSWLGGVPWEGLYDNPKTAVVRILAGPERQEHVLFSSLRAHYLFDSHFCRPAQAHEKGAVENLVGYVRRNALVPVPDFPSWETLNEHLLSWCEKDRERLKEGWAKEQAGLRPLPLRPFRAALTRLAPVSRLSLVSFDRNRYSVPCRYVGRNLLLAAFTNRIEAWDGDERVALHHRCFQRGELILLFEHYLPALARKPHAASHAAFVSQMPPIYALVRDQLCHGRPDGYREFAAILLLHNEFPADAVAPAVEEALRRGCLQAAAVRQILLNQTFSKYPLPVSVPEGLAMVTVSPPNLSQYDILLAGVPS
ncbi:MAG: IS21 family transposase [bacterium]|nr:IS21 family transposase [bacterium]